MLQQSKNFLKTQSEQYGCDFYTYSTYGLFYNYLKYIYTITPTCLFNNNMNYEPTRTDTQQTKEKTNNSWANVEAKCFSLNNTTELGFKKPFEVVYFAPKHLKSFSKHCAWLSCLIERLADIYDIKTPVSTADKIWTLYSIAAKLHGYIVQERLHNGRSKRFGMEL